MRIGRVVLWSQTNKISFNWLLSLLQNSISLLLVRMPRSGHVLSRASDRCIANFLFSFAVKDDQLRWVEFSRADRRSGAEVDGSRGR